MLQALRPAWVEAFMQKQLGRLVDAKRASQAGLHGIVPSMKTTEGLLGKTNMVQFMPYEVTLACKWRITGDGQDE